MKNRFVFPRKVKEPHEKVTFLLLLGNQNLR